MDTDSDTQSHPLSVPVEKRASAGGVDAALENLLAHRGRPRVGVGGEGWLVSQPKTAAAVAVREGGVRGRAVAPPASSKPIP